MDLPFFARGCVLGFSIAAVLGPIGLLCIRRTLTGGFAVGFVSGLGAATADATYAAAAGFGVTAIATVLVDQRAWLKLVGGVFLLYLGARALSASTRATSLASAADKAHTGPRHLAGAYASTLLLTLSNPMTIVSFGAIFAGLGLGSMTNRSTTSAVELVGGVFAGSAAWWLVLASLSARLRSFVTPLRLRAVNIVSGVLILSFGVQSLVSLAVTT